MKLPLTISLKIKALYYLFRKWLFSKIYPAPGIFTFGSKNFIGLERLVQLSKKIPDHQNLYHPLSVSLSAIEMRKNDFIPPDHFEATLIGSVYNGNIFKQSVGYVIFVGGNTTCYQIFMEEMISLHNKLKQDKKEAYIIGFNPPGVGLSPGEITGPDEYCQTLNALINNLLFNRINPENIIVVGHSLGAAIAAKTVAYFNERNLNIKLFADRTMNKLSNAVEAKLKNGLPLLLKYTLGNFLAMTAKSLINVFNLDLEVAADFTFINNKAPGSAYGMNADEDEMMADCSLIDGLPKEQLIYFRRFRLDPSHTHRSSHSKDHNKLISEDQSGYADQYFYDCISRLRTKNKQLIN